MTDHSLRSTSTYYNGGDTEPKQKRPFMFCSANHLSRTKIISDRFTNSFVKQKELTFANGQIGSLQASTVFSFRIDEHQTSKVHESGYENDDLCNSLRMFLRFGGILGILPISGLFRRDVKTEHLTFNSYSFPAITSYTVIIILTSNVLVGIYSLLLEKKSTAIDLASTYVSFFSMGLFMYVYFLRHSRQFVEFFRVWKSMKKLHFSSCDYKDVSLFRDINLVFALIFTSAILENMLVFCLHSQIIIFPHEKKIQAPLMDIFYHRSNDEWPKVYNGTNTTVAVLLGYYVFFSNKFALYAWNYADVMIIILSRAMYYKFKVLNKVARSQLMDFGTKEKCNDVQQWSQLAVDHSTLCQLLSSLEEFLSPVIFTCYATNTFFICLQIKHGLTPTSNTNFVQSTYFIWSLLHLLVRVYLVSLSAAKINQFAHETRKLYQSCPNEAYCLEVERSDNFLGSTQIGLTGLGCFVITKPFMLTIVGVVFTLEIVLLQTI